MNADEHTARDTGDRPAPWTAVSETRVNHNLFLGALSPADRESIEPYLGRRILRLGEILAERGDPLPLLHFIETGIVSCVVPLQDGHAVEACMIGNEGFTGLEASYAPVPSATRLLVQAEGRSRTLDSEIFRRLVRSSDTLQAAVAEYGWRLRTEIEQSTACNAVHLVEKRLAKWLLRCHDRSQGDVMHLTQEFLAAMLGTQRSTINQVAVNMAQSGAIKYSRGKVIVQNRVGLEATACECYCSTVATRDNRTIDNLLARQGCSPARPACQISPQRAAEAPPSTSR
jgi:CRP-like cAMP-binding protein